MSLDKKCKCVNFLCADKRLTHLNASDIKIKVLLDLFNAGYKNAYMSSMYFVSKQNSDYHRIEIVVPNVGSLHLYQTFVDVLDEQFPCIKVFYSSAANPNIRTNIQSRALLEYAIRIVYKAHTFFESHPEYISDSKELIKKIKTNANIIRKQYVQDMIKYHNLVKSFGKQK